MAKRAPNRRIVTGINKDGRHVVISDGPTPNVYGDPADPILINFWSTSQMPVDYRDPTDPAAGTMPLHPPPMGSMFRFFRVPPESRMAHLSAEERDRIVGAYYASVGAAHAHIPGARHAGFHRTESVDYIILLQGEVTLMLDDEDVPMQPFDVVIQRGTNHSWVNYGDETATLMAVLLSAEAPDQAT